MNTAQVHIEPAAVRTMGPTSAYPRAGPRAGPKPALERARPSRGMDLEQAAQELSSHFRVDVEISQDKNTGRNVVRIMSPDGQRLLRQLPPEEVIRLADQARLGSIKGLLTFMA